MISKVTQIRKLLRQGWTTREIAHELRVSLRDIGLVRKQEGIDIGALVRQKTRVEEEIAVLDESVAQKKKVIVQLEKQIHDLKRAKADLEAAIETKQSEIKIVHQQVEPIYFPQNYAEVRKYLKTLNLDHLRSLSQMITDILNDRTVSLLRDMRRQLRKEAQDNTEQIRIVPCDY